MRNHAARCAALVVGLWSSSALALDCTRHNAEKEQIKCLEEEVTTLRQEMEEMAQRLNETRFSAAESEARMVERMERRIREETEPRVRAPF
ncbi:MAG: hypothetical protein AB7S70_16130 [Hyphomicrobium sp.]|uniref:hypothetical protein n=1 Tax=Hyphomicrobium sp. TaxID=82 RepID=UPI003D13C69D